MAHTETMGRHVSGANETHMDVLVARRKGRFRRKGLSGPAAEAELHWRRSYGFLEAKWFDNSYDARVHVPVAHAALPRLYFILVISDVSVVAAG